VAAVECLAWARNSFGCLIRMMMRSYSQQRCLALKLRLLSIARKSAKQLRWIGAF
jgi:hypothetical protein